MTPREQMLNQIRKNKPSLAALPEIPLFKESEELLTAFGNCLQKIGGTFVELDDVASLPEFLQRQFPALSHIASSFLPSTFIIDSNTDKHILERVELAVLRAEFGVAENGAVWLPEHEMLHRALPFITQHLVLLLRKDALVSTMHQAYERLHALPAYGVFIAGPSKTADIEQSLVIGAHGARSMTLVLH